MAALRVLLIFLSWAILSGLGGILVEVWALMAVAEVVKGEDETGVLTLLF